MRDIPDLMLISIGGAALLAVAILLIFVVSVIFAGIHRDTSSKKR
jgi:type II secretory pathway component PulK